LAIEMVFGLKTPFWGMKVNPRTIVDEVLALAPERSFAGIYAGMHLRYAQEAGNKPRFGEKTPYNLFFVGPMAQDFPNAQFIFITRDGRDASCDYIDSSFGPTNIFCAADIWKRCQEAVKPHRPRLAKEGRWLDVKYEELVRQPEKVLRGICDFLGEKYEPGMLDFHQTDLAKARGATRDHAPLGHPVSDRYIGIHKDQLSLRDQRIFAAVAGQEMADAGYELDVEPEMPSQEMQQKFREFDGRIRAATMDGFEGHIVYESYNDWLVDQREARRRQGLWSAAGEPKVFPIGDPDEEIITGQRAHRRWKDYLCVKRQYVGKLAL
ncbi:MAG: sulfotransferase, partial [Desulfovibrio sp.]|nr:sulfotransferase [Desulfovibrio sp.]